MNFDDDELLNSISAIDNPHRTLQTSTLNLESLPDEYTNTIELPSHMVSLDNEQIQKPKLINNFASLAPSDDFCEISKAKQSERDH